MKQEDKTYQVIDGVRYEVRDKKYFYDKCLYIKETNNGHLPYNLTISGSLYIDNSPRFKALPKNLTVKQNLYLRHTPIKTLPSGLNVGECLEMEHSKITSLPEDLKVGKTINLQNTPIETLPDNLIVNKDLDVSYCTKLKCLPENLIVGGSLYVKKCNSLEKLPEGLIVGGYLYITGCQKIKEIPFNKIGGGLSLNKTAITNLPDNLTLGGYLNISSSDIKELPYNIQIQRCLSLSDTTIEKLPDNMIIGDGIQIYNCPYLLSLPDNLTVGGSFYMSRSQIKSLPNKLIVRTQMGLYDCFNIKSLPNDLVVGDEAFFTYTGITGKPKINHTIPVEKIYKLNQLRHMAIVWKRNYKTYIKIHDNFTVVDSKRGNVYYTHVLGTNEQLYIVTDGKNNWTYGQTKEEAWIKLIYSINSKDIVFTPNMTMEARITKEEALNMYKEVSNRLYTTSSVNIEYVLKQFEKDGITLNDLYTLMKNSFGEDVITNYFTVRDSSQKIEQMHQQNVITLTTDKPIIITLNGVGFYKKLNQKLQKPFDSKFNKLMNKTLIYLLEKLPYTKVGYTWRYEMNIIINIPTYFNTNALWKRDISKIQSIVTSMASTFFTREYHKLFQTEDNTTLFEFNCQTWNTPTIEDAYNWLVYRQEECMDNSIKRFARFFLTTQEMKGKTSEELIKYLIEHYNTNWNYEKADNKLGRVFIKQNVIQFDIDEKTNEQKVYGKEEWSNLGLFFFSLKDEKIKEIIINEINKIDE
jgi:leucine-rich repeat protein